MHLFQLTISIRCYCLMMQVLDRSGKAHGKKVLGPEIVGSCWPLLQMWMQGARGNRGPLPTIADVDAGHVDMLQSDPSVLHLLGVRYCVARAAWRSQEKMPDIGSFIEI
jgi:hypothetical protein